MTSVPHDTQSERRATLIRRCIAVLLLGACAATAALTLVARRVPFRFSGQGPEAHGIVSATTLLRDRPEHTVVLYAAAVAALALATGLLAFDWRWPEGGRARRLAPPSLAVAAILAVLAAAKMPWFGTPLADTFHEGEYLGFAGAFTAGRGFGDAFFIHGFGMQAVPGIVAFAVDPTRVVVWARLVRFAMLVATWVGIAAAVAALLRSEGSSRPWRSAVAVTAALIGLDGFLFTVTERYLVSAWQLALVVGWFAGPRGPRRTRALLVGASVAIAFLHNYAEALNAGALVIAALALVAVRDRRASGVWSAWTLLGGGFATLVISAVAPGFWAAALEQITYWARFGGPIWHQDPSTRNEWLRFWTIVAVEGVALGAVAAGARHEGWAARLREDSVVVLLAVWAAVVARAQLNRGDAVHLAWASLPCALLVVVFVHRILQRTGLPGGRPLVATTLVALTAIVVARSTASGAPSFSRRIASIRATDAELFPPEHLQAARAVSAAVGESGCFYTLTSEGSWYAVLRTPSCSRFHQLAYARTLSAQQEVVQALEQGRPAVILVGNDFWANAIDGVPTTRSNAVVWSYVNRAYEPLMTVGTQRFWRLRQAAPDAAAP